MLGKLSSNENCRRGDFVSNDFTQPNYFPRVIDMNISGSVTLDADLYCFL